MQKKPNSDTATNFDLEGYEQLSDLEEDLPAPPPIDRSPLAGIKLKTKSCLKKGLMAFAKAPDKPRFYQKSLTMGSKADLRRCKLPLRREKRIAPDEDQASQANSEGSPRRLSPSKMASCSLNGASGFSMNPKRLRTSEMGLSDCSSQMRGLSSVSDYNCYSENFGKTPLSEVGSGGGCGARRDRIGSLETPEDSFSLERDLGDIFKFK